MNVEVVYVGCERAIGEGAVRLNGNGIRAVSINERRLDERERDGLAGLPAGAGDIHCGPRRVVGFVGLDGGEAVKFAALKRGAGGVLTARDEQQSVLAERAAGRARARGSHDAGRVERPGPGDILLGRIECYAG